MPSHFKTAKHEHLDHVGGSNPPPSTYNYLVSRMNEKITITAVTDYEGEAIKITDHGDGFIVVRINNGTMSIPYDTVRAMYATIKDE